MSEEQTEAAREYKIRNEADCPLQELGYKIECYACRGEYYDLGKDDPTCPYCKSVYSAAQKKKSAKKNAEAAAE